MVRQRSVLIAAAAALATFLLVQDQLTTRGARRYAALQRAALTGRGGAVTVDGVMRPAVSGSVRQGLLWGGSVFALGLAGTAAAARRGSRRR